jgi:hypothetical protein
MHSFYQPNGTFLDNIKPVFGLPRSIPYWHGFKAALMNHIADPPHNQATSGADEYWWKTGYKTCLVLGKDAAIEQLGERAKQAEVKRWHKSLYNMKHRQPKKKPKPRSVSQRDKTPEARAKRLASLKRYRDKVNQQIKANMQGTSHENVNTCDPT